MKISFTQKEIIGEIVSPNSPYDVNGLDLGYPIHDKKRDCLYYLFGDTFYFRDFLNATDLSSLNWRSQVMGRVKNVSKRSDYIIDDFYPYKEDNKAGQLFHSYHEDKLEMTKIPTGGVILNDILYLPYFAINSWWDIPIEERMLYGGFAKMDLTSDDPKFVRVPDMSFINPFVDQEALRKVIDDHNENEKIDIRSHTINYFTEIYPKDFGDEYIYLYGQGAYRNTRLYLARVRKENIEDFSKVEYFCGFAKDAPLFKKGVDNALSPLTKDIFGEFSLIYIKEFDVYLLFHIWSKTGDVVYRYSKSKYGPFSEPEILIKKTDPVFLSRAVYAPLTTEYLYKDGYLTFSISRWAPDYMPILIRFKMEVEL